MSTPFINPEDGRSLVGATVCVYIKNIYDMVYDICINEYIYMNIYIHIYMCKCIHIM